MILRESTIFDIMQTEVKATIARLYRVGVTFSASKLAREGVVIATAAAATTGKSKKAEQSIGVFASRKLAAGAALPAADGATTQQHRRRFRQFLFASKCPQPVHFEVRRHSHQQGRTIKCLDIVSGPN